MWRWKDASDDGFQCDPMTAGCIDFDYRLRYVCVTRVVLNEWQIWCETGIETTKNQQPNQKLFVITRYSFYRLRLLF